MSSPEVVFLTSLSLCSWSNYRLCNRTCPSSAQTFQNLVNSSIHRSLPVSLISRKSIRKFMSFAISQTYRQAMAEIMKESVWNWRRHFKALDERSRPRIPCARGTAQLTYDWILIRYIESEPRDARRKERLPAGGAADAPECRQIEFQGGRPAGCLSRGTVPSFLELRGPSIGTTRRQRWRFPGEVLARTAVKSRG